MTKLELLFLRINLLATLSPSGKGRPIFLLDLTVPTILLRVLLHCCFHHVLSSYLLRHSSRLSVIPQLHFQIGNDFHLHWSASGVSPYSDNKPRSGPLAFKLGWVESKAMHKMQHDCAPSFSSLQRLWGMCITLWSSLSLDIEVHRGRQHRSVLCVFGNDAYLHDIHNDSVRGVHE